MTNRIDIVDLSHWNTVTDFAAAEAAGLIGVILKATEGTSHIDETFAQRREQAEAAGLIVSSYHYLKHGDVNAQMAHYLNVVDPVSGERVCIDHEDPAATLDDLRAAVKYLRQTDLDLQICIYAGSLLKQQLGSKRDDLLATCALWLAQYTSGSPSWPSGTWAYWSLWQYSDGTSGGSPKDLPGISAPHDCNVFNGSPENAAKWLAPATGEPGPSPAPDIEVVEIAIKTPANVAIQVTVNGTLIAGGRFP